MPSRKPRSRNIYVIAIADLFQNTLTQHKVVASNWRDAVIKAERKREEGELDPEMLQWLLGLPNLKTDAYRMYRDTDRLLSVKRIK